jgi:hypothetical protein
MAQLDLTPSQQAMVKTLEAHGKADAGGNGRDGCVISTRV